MKKMFVILMTISLFSFSGYANSHNNGKTRSGNTIELIKKGGNPTNVIKLLKKSNPPKAQCFDCTFYLTCGYVWAGNVCVETNLAYITDEQFETAWRYKQIELCGSNPMDY